MSPVDLNSPYPPPTGPIAPARKEKKVASICLPERQGAL